MWPCLLASCVGRFDPSERTFGGEGGLGWEEGGSSLRPRGRGHLRKPIRAMLRETPSGPKCGAGGGASDLRSEEERERGEGEGTAKGEPSDL